MAVMTKETPTGLGETRVRAAQRPKPDPNCRFIAKRAIEADVVEEKIVKRVVTELKSLLGDKLKKVILYGSYARGDFDYGSDVDIMVLLDMDRKAVHDQCKLVRGIAHDISLDCDIHVSTMVESVDFFFEKLNANRFYRNVLRDGRVFYGE